MDGPDFNVLLFVAGTTTRDYKVFPLVFECATVDVAARRCDRPDSKGDADSDGDRDLADFAGYPNCFGTGQSGGGLPANCRMFDLVPDDAVDLSDFAELIPALCGP